MTRPEAPQIRDGVVFVGGVRASELALRYGTPLYVLDGAVVDANLNRMRRAFSHPRVNIYYSCKANPSVGLLRHLRAAGVRLDACSPGDLVFGRAAGFGDDEVSFTGHALSDEELCAVAESGVAFTADSLGQIERFARSASPRAIGIRLNCGIEAGFHPHVRAGSFTSKFGIHRSQLPDALELARRLGLRIVGVHSHLGSDLASYEPHLELLDALLDAGASVPDLEWVNLGGGWGDHGEHRYDFGAFGREVDRRLASAERRLSRGLELRLEPGGYLVMTAGCLIARVTDAKPAVEVGELTTPAFIGTDTSYNHLVSAVIYGAQHPIWLADRAGAAPDGRFDVVGNLMQAGDVIARERPLPEPQVGEVLVVGRCGGYAAWRAPPFNERPRPADVLVAHGEETLLRRAETEEDLLALEVL